MDRWIFAFSGQFNKNVNMIMLLNFLDYFQLQFNFLTSNSQKFSYSAQTYTLDLLPQLTWKLVSLENLMLIHLILL